jgi:hypothetical protein
MVLEYSLKGTRFIYDLSILLTLPHATTITAMTLFHHFIAATKKQFSHKDHKLTESDLPHRYELASTVLWMATKLTESPRPLSGYIERVIRVAIRQPRFKLPPDHQQDKSFISWHRVLINTEWIVLQRLGSRAYMTEIPHAYLDTVVRVLIESELVSLNDFDGLMNAAWCWLTDLVRLDGEVIRLHVYVQAVIGVVLAGGYMLDFTSSTRQQWIAALLPHDRDRKAVVVACKNLLALSQHPVVAHSLEGPFQSMKQREEREQQQMAFKRRLERGDEEEGELPS